MNKQDLRTGNPSTPIADDYEADEERLVRHCSLLGTVFPRRTPHVIDPWCPVDQDQVGISQ